MSTLLPEVKLTPEDSDNDNEPLECDEQESLREYGRGGYRLVKIGDTFKDNRYRVIRKLGWGAFSTVWLCTDKKKADYVAIKVAKGKASLRESSDEEIEMLLKIKSADSCDPFRRRIVTLLNHFTVRGINGVHNCLVFEVMGDSLFKFQTTYHKKGVPLEYIKRIVANVLEGLCYLHKKCGLIHTDIKPENVLLTIDKTRVKRMHSEVKQLIGVCGEQQLPESFVSIAAIKNRKSTGPSTPTANDNKENRIDNQNPIESLDQISVKIADLGNACPINEYHSSTIQTRPYRSPEVLLGCGYGPSADIWSTACMIYELVTGEYLFDYKAKDKHISKNEIQLARIIELMGPIPKECRKGRHYNKLFTKSGQLFNYKVIKDYNLDTYLIEQLKWEPTVAQGFTQFLLPMLEINPRKRANASQCLSHQWLNN